MPPLQSVNISRVMIPQAVLDALPAGLVRRHAVLPVAREGEVLFVVLADPDSDAAIMQIESQTPYHVRVLETSDSQAVRRAIRRYYPDTPESAEGSALAVLNRILGRALQMRCSDIHLDPGRDGGLVRMRIDGMMRTERKLERGLCNDLIQAIKVAASLDIAERRIPQDGQISMRVEQEDLALRVATIPALHGEKVTLRILATAAITEDLSVLHSLGMTTDHLALMLDALRQSNGMILLSGPTGSGKTTTLYAALRHLNEPGTAHILSIEDPVEIPLSGINQIHVDAERVSFNAALRSALRHDPDVIMVGEIRDAETADIAMKASMTGHLVLSTLHTNHAIGVVARLLQLGAPPSQLVTTLRLVVAQRLVRCPCPHCMTQEPPTAEQIAIFGDDLTGADRFPAAQGCSLCADTGYAGRTGLYEMVPMTQRLRAAILEGMDENGLLREQRRQAGYRTLVQDGIRKGREGQTTLDEVLRVTYAGGDE